jgi:O-antigen biosynthesis protein
METSELSMDIALTKPADTGSSRSPAEAEASTPVASRGFPPFSPGHPSADSERATSTSARLRVDGKFLAQGNQRFRVYGVTYGPFAPTSDGQPFPLPGRVDDDFRRMKAAAINSLRVYHLPPEWLLDKADEQGLAVFVDIPWAKHLCFLDNGRAQAAARAAVRQAAERGRNHPSLLAYSIGNEVPPDIVRWHGARCVSRFLRELADVAKQADPEGLVTYGNYPPTEYLQLDFLDFITFNVYLHDREPFRRYLLRLQNLVGDKPLLLGELGMDTLRHGELQQAAFLSSHVKETLLLGLAGAMVFSWTDQWYTGGYAIEDWAFGIVREDRSPKASYHALGEIFEKSPTDLLVKPPRVSVVVCTYNGGRTLEQCLRSLLALDYPDYEVIVVDDGSTDETPALLARFPEVRSTRQANEGLSRARNRGLQMATGSIIAYTDSDCFADPAWLTHLVYQLEQSGAAGVGGPNLTPADGRLAACVAAAPGQPIHVLESEQVAEHIPGCNMAFRRAVLEAVNGFDPQFRKAGDDVDLCWRLQQAGFWITFAPGAMVWHHRRATPRAYLRQQAGYGEAEALLRFKHPDKFNGRGDGLWRGVVYSHSVRSYQRNDAIIYRGTFATGFFQCLYQPGPVHWAMLPTTLEWHLLAAAAALSALFWIPAWLVVATMLGLSVLMAAILADQARLPEEHDGFFSRFLVTGLYYLQPLVRSWQRYHTRLFAYRLPTVDSDFPKNGFEKLPLSGVRTVAYWADNGTDRTALLRRVVDYLTERRWGKILDSGWSDWDMEIYCHPWTVVQVCTAQENHGGEKYLIRVRYRMRPSGYTKIIGWSSILVALMGIGLPSWLTLGGVLLLAAFYLGLWWRGTYRAAKVTGVFDVLAEKMGMFRCKLLSNKP